MKLSNIAAMMKESDKIRLYLASFLTAIEEPVPSEPDKKMVTTYHYADFIEAQDIEMAKQMACATVDEQWPKSHGWMLRSVTIDPVQPDSIKRLLQAWQAGLIAQQIEPSEKGIEVNCDTGVSREHADILIETDRPPS